MIDDCSLTRRKLTEALRPTLLNIVNEVCAPAFAAALSVLSMGQLQQTLMRLIGNLT